MRRVASFPLVVLVVMVRSALVVHFHSKIFFVCAQ